LIQSFAIKHDFSGLFGALDEIEDGAQINLRPAAQAGAQVLYEEVKIRVPVKAKTTTRKGKILPPGALRDSIYQVFSEDNSGPNRSTYHISWNARKAPHGHLVENGTSRAPAHPFIRPAYDAKGKVALEVSNARWTEDMRQLIASFK
jgi:HK97 gp10 family phage protein